MRMPEPTAVNDPNLQLRIQKRYEPDILSLRRLGFHMLGYLLETESPFSAVLQLPMLLLMLLNGEVLAFPSPLRLAIGTVLLQHPDPSTVGLCMGKGVKLYTHFTDSSILISSTFYSYAVPRPGSKIMKPLAPAPVEALWPAHLEYARQLEAQGRPILPTRTFHEFVELSKSEEDRSQYQ